jgi:hypothetical protein
MVGQWVVHRGTVMRAAPSRSETDAPDGSGRHGERRSPGSDLKQVQAERFDLGQHAV